MARILASDAFESLLAATRPYFETLPTPETVDHDMVGELLAVAESRPWAREAQTTTAAVVERYPDAPFSLFLVEQEFENKRKASTEDALAYLEETEAAHPGSMAAGRAVSLRLRSLLSSSEADFIDACRDLIDEDTSSMEGRAALFERFRYFARERRSKKAALDGLLFWSRFPDTVEKGDLQREIARELRDAGLSLESEALPLAEDPQPVAEYLYHSFTASPGTPSRAYFDDSSSATALAEMDDSDSSPEERLLTRFRAAMRPLEEGDANAAVLFLQSAVHVLEERTLPAGEASPSGETAIAGAALAAILAQSVKMLANEELGQVIYGNNVWRTMRRDFLPVVRELSACKAETALSALNREEERPSAFASRWTEHIDRLKKIEDNEGVLQAYDRFIDRYPDSTEAFSFRLDLADFYQEPLESPSKALEEYRYVYEHALDATQRATGLLKIVFAAVQDNNFEDAYSAGQEFLSEFPREPRVPTAHFLLATAEDALGLSGDAVYRMETVAREFPQSVIAPRALYWLGTHFLSQQQYERAAKNFIDIYERYPDSELAGKARSTAERLASNEN